MIDDCPKGKTDGSEANDGSGNGGGSSSCQERQCKVQTLDIKIIIINKYWQKFS